MSRPFLHPLELARAARDNDARRAIEALEGKPRNVVIGPVWAMPTARAGHASHRAVLHRLGHSVPIAIAAFALLYFAAEFLR